MLRVMLENCVLYLKKNVHAVVELVLMSTGNGVQDPRTRSHGRPHSLAMPASEELP